MINRVIFKLQSNFYISKCYKIFHLIFTFLTNRSNKEVPEENDNFYTVWFFDICSTFIIILIRIKLYIDCNQEWIVVSGVENPSGFNGIIVFGPKCIAGAIGAKNCSERMEGNLGKRRGTCPEVGVMGGGDAIKGGEILCCKKSCKSMILEMCGAVAGQVMGLKKRGWARKREWIRLFRFGSKNRGPEGLFVPLSWLRVVLRWKGVY